jgi:NAD(P)-dependent dehydrogenase (short-subunit alcohol dehydrogenase family)
MGPTGSLDRRPVRDIAGQREPDARCAKLLALRRRLAGRLSSLAAYIGMPIAPTYCASKAALKVYGEALRAWLAPQGFRVNVVLPGFVHNPLSASFAGAKPFLLTPRPAPAQTDDPIPRAVEGTHHRIYPSATNGLAFRHPS